MKKMPTAFVYYFELDGKMKEFVNADAYRKLAEMYAQLLREKG